MNEKKANYIKNDLENTINVSGIYTIHYFKYGKNFRVRTEFHDFWEMVYIDSGEAVVIADGKEFKLKKGEAFFHKPNEKHTIYTENEFANSAIISFECLSGELSEISGKPVLLNRFEKEMISLILGEARLSFSDRLDDIYLNKMTPNTSPAPFYGQQIKNAIEFIIISLLRRQSENPVKPKNEILNENNQIVNEIEKILNENIYSKVTLSDLEDKLSFSKTYIKSVFKKYKNESIIQHYINLKINEAKKLLSLNKYTVTEISRMLNFNSVHYFSRQFKKQTEMSPTSYISSIEKDNILK